MSDQQKKLAMTQDGYHDLSHGAFVGSASSSDGTQELAAAIIEALREPEAAAREIARLRAELAAMTAERDKWRTEAHVLARRLQALTEV